MMFLVGLFISLIGFGQYLPAVYNTGTQVNTVITNDKSDPVVGIDSVFSYYTDSTGINFITGKVKYQANKSGKWMNFDWNGGAGIMTFINVPEKENKDVLTGIPFRGTYKIGARINGELRQLNPFLVTYNEEKTEHTSGLIAMPMDLYHFHIKSESVGDKIELVECPFLQWRHIQLPVQGLPMINITQKVKQGDAINVYSINPSYLYHLSYKIKTGYDSKVRTGSSFKYQGKWYQRAIILGKNDFLKGLVELEVSGKDYQGNSYTFVYAINLLK